MRPLIFHIPHASTAVPPEVRKGIVLDDAALAEEFRVLTDHHTDTLFEPCAKSSDTIVRFAWSRLVTDVERFPDDADEAMSKCGMGAVYTSGHAGQILRTSLHPREDLMQRFYHPHHHALEAAVAGHLASHGSALIVDCHSFPETAKPYEADQSLHRPEICIGTDAFHTAEEVAVALEEAYRAHGYEVCRNTPFSGSMVPASQYRREQRVMSVMIELRRDIYMDEATGSMKPDIARLRGANAAAIDALRGLGDG